MTIFYFPYQWALQQPNYIIKLLMNRTSKADYILVIAVLGTLLLRASSAIPNSGMRPIDKYITVTTVKFDIPGFFDINKQASSSTYEYVLPSAQTDNSYQIVVIPQISLSYENAKSFAFDAFVQGISPTSISAILYVRYPQTYTLFSIDILFIEPQFNNAIFMKFDYYSPGPIDPLFLETKLDQQVVLTPTTTIFSSIIGCDITVGNSGDFGFSYSASISEDGYLKTIITSTNTVVFNLDSVSYVNIFVDRAKLLLVSPAATITFGIFGDSTGTNSNLKVIDKSNKMRSYNTLIGLTSLRMNGGTMEFRWIVTPSVSIEARSSSGWKLLQFDYMIFEFEGCLEGFIFDSASNSCVCPLPNSVAVGGKCFPCANISLYSNGTAFNTSTCNCNETFIFNSAAKTCDCLLPNSVAVGENCFACGNISLYSNGTAFNTSTCNCNETFTFDSTTKTCVCPQENSVIIEGKCFPCGSIALYSNGTVFNESTCNCNQSFIFDKGDKKCVCLLPNSVAVGENCFACGNIPLYSNRTAFNTSTCNCNETFIFNSTTKTCVCPQENSVVIEGKCFPCGNILQYSNRTVFNESTCNCNGTFIFNSAAKTCDCPLPNSVVIGGKCFPCANIPLYSNGTAFNSSTCNCNETFIFNSTTKTCVCPQENSVVIGGKCFSCFTLINFYSSGLINSSQPDSCECNSTFAFNKTAKACQCPPNSIFLDNKCFSCADLKDKNSSGLVNLTSDYPACQCFPTFVFNTTSKACECPDSDSYISLDGRCVSCSGVGPVDQANRSCICEPNYIYNRITNKCICSLNKLFALSNCFSCSSIRYLNSTGLVDSKDGSSRLCECYLGFVFNPQTNVCQCPDPLSYVSITRVCVSCRDIGNNTNEVNGTACVCSQSYIYNANLNKCLCPLFSIIINNLCFSCSTLRGKNSSGLVSPTNPKQCQCTVTFTFNAETKQCGCPNDVNYFVSRQNKCVSCLNIENGNGEALISSKVCQCNETYIYSAIENKCICPARSIVLQNGQCFSCQTLKSKNSSGLVNTVTKNTCQCFKTFFFNPTNKACECPQGQFVSKRGKCFSCAGAEGTGEFNQTSKECICNETYIYSSSLNKCICPTTSVVINSQCFVCSTLKGKNGTGEISKTSSSVCQCLKSFVFTEEKTCECPNAANSFVSKGGLCVSCLGIANGLNDEADLTSKKCVCKQSFVYHQGTNQCRCPLSSVIIGGFCFQCSTLKNKNSTGAVSNTDPSSCSCLTSFVFNPVSKVCQCPNEANSFVSSAGKCVSCIGIQNGQNDEANITSRTCVCKSSFVYVGSANKCECPQSSIVVNGECFSCSTLMNKNSTGGVNATTGNTCRCLRSYVFNPDAKVCQCPDDAHSYITPTKQCVSCSEVQNGTGAATKDGCECKDSSFVYNPSLNKCLCPPTHVFSGGSCILTSKSQTNKEVTCPENLNWDIFLQKCVCKPGFVLKGNLCIDCTSIANAKGDASDKISCICAEGYAWDSTEYLCK